MEISVSESEISFEEFDSTKLDNSSSLYKLDLRKKSSSKRRPASCLFARDFQFEEIQLDNLDKNYGNKLSSDANEQPKIKPSYMGGRGIPVFGLSELPAAITKHRLSDSSEQIKKTLIPSSNDIRNISLRKHQIVNIEETSNINPFPVKLKSLNKYIGHETSEILDLNSKPSTPLSKEGITQNSNSKMFETRIRTLSQSDKKPVLKSISKDTVKQNKPLNSKLNAEPEIKTVYQKIDETPKDKIIQEYDKKIVNPFPVQLKSLKKPNIQEETTEIPHKASKPEKLDSEIQKNIPIKLSDSKTKTKESIEVQGRYSSRSRNNSQDEKSKTSQQVSKILSGENQSIKLEKPLKSSYVNININNSENKTLKTKNTVIENNPFRVKLKSLRKSISQDTHDIVKNNVSASSQIVADKPNSFIPIAKNDNNEVNIQKYSTNNKPSYITNKLSIKSSNRKTIEETTGLSQSIKEAASPKKNYPSNDKLIEEWKISDRKKMVRKLSLAFEPSKDGLESGTEIKRETEKKLSVLQPSTVLKNANSTINKSTSGSNNHPYKLKKQTSKQPDLGKNENNSSNTKPALYSNPIFKNNPFLNDSNSSLDCIASSKKYKSEKSTEKEIEKKPIINADSYLKGGVSELKKKFQ